MSSLFQDGEKDVMLYANALVHKSYEFMMTPIVGAVEDDEIPLDIRNHLKKLIEDSKNTSDKINTFIQNLSSDGNLNVPSTIMALLVNAMYLYHLSEFQTSSVSKEDLNDIIGTLINDEPKKSNNSELDSFMKMMKEFDSE